LGPLADKFQELGDASLAAGDIVEAAAHYKHSVEADPAREDVAKKLAEIKAEIESAEEGSK
jgi:predicted negative regulator of RcsB-dependent stress response